MHLAVDAHGLPVRILVTKGTRADCKEAKSLIKGLSAECLLADKEYDANHVIKQVLSQGMKVVIPPKKNREMQRDYDQYLYKFRHLVENAFLHLKRWRGINTRYAKHAKSFLAAIQIRSMVLWLK